MLISIPTLDDIAEHRQNWTKGVLSAAKQRVMALFRRSVGIQARFTVCNAKQRTGTLVPPACSKLSCDNQLCCYLYHAPIAQL